jgi:hypothetical protein
MPSDDTQYLLDIADSSGISFAGDLQDDTTSRTTRCREDNLLVSIFRQIGQSPQDNRQGYIQWT